MSVTDSLYPIFPVGGYSRIDKTHHTRGLERRVPGLILIRSGFWSRNDTKRVTGDDTVRDGHSLGWIKSSRDKSDTKVSWGNIFSIKLTVRLTKRGVDGKPPKHIRIIINRHQLNIKFPITQRSSLYTSSDPSSLDSVVSDHLSHTEP